MLPFNSFQSPMEKIWPSANLLRVYLLSMQKILQITERGGNIYFKSALESSRFIMLPEPRWIFNTNTILKVNAEIQLTDPKLLGQ